MDIYAILKNISIMIVPILMAVTLHELAHGYTAERLGDPTARMAGRLSLNPIKHLDFFGTLVFVITQRIGWAKPVPVNPGYFRNPRRDMMWVALAGPAANIGLAVFFSIILRFIGKLEALGTDSVFSVLFVPISLMCIMGVILNIGLAVFNLTPIPPLDGSKILLGLLPRKQAQQYARIEPYGFLILMLLLFLPGLREIFTGGIIYPLIHLLTQMLLNS